MHNMEEKEFKALISLLADEDELVYKLVEQKLLEEGGSIISDLENAWDGTINELLHERLENIIQKIQFDKVLNGMSKWAKSDSQTLLKGAYLIAKYQYPELLYEDIILKIEKIKRDSWLQMRDNFTALEQVRILNYIIYDIHKLARNTTNYHSPQNSFLNNVLENKKGNPVSLAIIYASVAQRLEMPIYGVNLPKNFILAYMDERGPYLSTDKKNNEVLFYINPYNRGAVLGKREIDYFLKQQKLEPKESFYTPCDNITTIQRLILSLIYAYEKLGYPNKIDDLKKLNRVLGKKLLGNEY